MAASPDALTSLLAIDTSTATLSVAAAVLRPDGAGPVIVGHSEAAGRHTGSRLPLAVQQVLAEANLAPHDLSGVVVGVGPGPYTSLRVGVVFAKAVAAVHDIPVLGVCSLDILARQRRNEPASAAAAGGPASEGEAQSPGADGSGDFIATGDARRREVYWARYDRHGERTLGPLVNRPDELPADIATLPQVGVATSETPDARALATWAITEWAHVGGAPSVSDINPAWDQHADDGSGAASIPTGFLVPRPLYLRQPDVTLAGA